MVFRVNYGMQRAERNRVAQGRNGERQRKREEKSAQRKATRTEEVSTSFDLDSAKENR
jgi:hypothetical protein